jgi:hypothetical protein
MYISQVDIPTTTTFSEPIIMSLAQMLSANTSLELLPSNKIRCKITGHEMPPRADVIAQYLGSKRFVKAKNWYTVDYSEYLPHIIPAKDDSKRLYCRLTKKTLNRIPEVGIYLLMLTLAK